MTKAVVRAGAAGEVLDLNGGAHLKRYPNVYDHIMKLAGQ
jgi:3-oxoacyl-[acyl-carrier protein] reductase